ncbi:MAG: zinc ribbon domain-containing protein [Stellaceae bacterium]
MLAGLVRCRRCGRKLTVRYTGTKHNIPRYSCHRGLLDADSGGSRRALGRSQRDPAGEGPAGVRPSEPPRSECCGCDR